MDHTDPYGLHPRKDPHYFPPKPAQPISPQDFMRNLLPKETRDRNAGLEGLRRLHEMKNSHELRIMRAALDKEVEWTGDDTRVSVKKAIEILNKVKDILIIPHHSFLEEYAKLRELEVALPPGRKTPRAILNLIREQTGTTWDFDEDKRPWIVLKPQNEEQRTAFNGTGNLIKSTPDSEALVILKGKDFARRVAAMSPDEKQKLFMKMVADRRSEAAEQDEPEQNGDSEHVEGI